MLAVSAALLLALVVRVLEVQGPKAASLAAYGAAEQTEKIAVPAARGTIYDRNGTILAMSVPRVDVVADDYLIRSRTVARRSARRLARLLALPEATLLHLLGERDGYVPLALEVSPGTERKVSALHLPFLSFVPDELRVDPAGTLFSPLLGVVGYGGKGLSGLEYLEQRELAGTAGSEDLVMGASGAALPDGGHSVVHAVQGDGLVLTLDEPLQYEVTRALSAEMRAQSAESGICVVLDAKTGGVLALVNLERHGRRVVPAAQNLATDTVYQPGSVMKLATISGALQEGLITPSEEFRVPDSITVGGWPFQDADFHPTENLPVSQILARSSNVGTIEIAHLLGAPRLSYFLHDLGFGQVTGLDWPGESAGLLPPLSDWSAADMGTIPIGTGEAVTAMQIVDAYNAVANGGVYVPPRLVEAVVGPDGKERVLPPTARHRVLDAATVDALIPMLEGVTSDGTGTLAQVPGYVVAGKTGTAQIPSTTGPGYQAGAWNATFVGFVPAGNPKLTAIVVLRHPAAMYGGSAAAPVFSTIMKYALRHFDISPSGAVSPSGSSAASAG